MHYRFYKSFVVTLLFVTVLGVPYMLFAHGDSTQLIDTEGLKPLGEVWQEENPYRGNQLAIEIGSDAYMAQCARCHGLGAVSGGISPDLRKLPEGLDGDEWFIMRVRNGVVRNGMTYMPSFENIFSQEAMWTIRSWLDTVRIDE